MLTALDSGFPDVTTLTAPELRADHPVPGSTDPGTTPRRFR
jgi:hypothetical protein